MKTNRDKIFFSFFILMAVAALVSCTKKYVDINTNPNASTAASPQSLLAPTLMNLVSGNLGRNVRINNEFMQVTVTTADSREFHRYEVKPSESDAQWRLWYLQLTNIRDIYRNAEKTQQAGYKTFQGISLILDAWVGSLLTDMYGDVPYSESNLGYEEQNLTPVFDSQKSIYELIFNKLEAADTLLKLNAAVPSEFEYADPIFKCSPDLWRRFGNSLYLRLLMRVAHKTDIDARERIYKIVEEQAANYPLMTDNSGSAILKFTGVTPFQSPFATTRDFDFNGDKGYSEFFINNLVTLKDPRLPVWATEASLGVYGGMQSGYVQGNIPDRQSTLQLALKTEPLLGNIMNYAEVQFLLAEAALKGYISKPYRPYYQNGVKASVELWGKTIDTATYFKTPLASIDSAATDTDKLKRIHLQKYFAMMFTDFQQWYEYRRTGALDLYIGPGLQNGSKMPSRMVYPTLVQTLNRANYDKAVAAMGGNGINQKVWWQQ
ncbi:SusD/RagB family nutrient-binding outer membrane lipoprotein [Niabella drilacis]|uniref:Starch-binding associating with outer membrane n=1 Tax=Niabella drilacis (strain DSM 25811 / CCM 8410 / CCUG 62505 / LMG 26954 / E90) TaxID=1285928 RepID=A0A1G6XBK7_NIADE|nr:SusD/RagB family nutrient-binding outer membrane lipoprotein [Niabella drilacis]SDD75589.1 Starch-binding associating with outer membrane [Niabella drilacis]